MDRILTNNAVDGQPFTSPTSLDMLQDAYKGGFSEIAKSLIGSSYSPSKPYVLWGCATTNAPSISEGAIFFNGEVYHLDAWAPGVACPDTQVINISTSYAPGDPIIYASGASHNTHQIRKAVAGCGTSGSGTIGDFTDLVYINTANIEYLYTASSIAAITVNFDKNKVLTFNNTGGSGNTITLNCDRCISGREVMIRTAIGTAGHTIDFSGATGVTPVPVNVAGFPFTLGANTFVCIKMRAVEVATATWAVYIEIYNP